MNRFKKGMFAVHKKMQIIAVVKKAGSDSIQVEISETLPLQDWNPKDVEPWNQEDSIKKRLKKGGYLRNISLNLERRKAKKG